MAKEETIELTIDELELALAAEADVERLQVFQDELLDKSWDELEVEEFAGYLLFPEKLWKRAKNGKFVAEKVMVRVPRGHEMRKARAEAHRIAKKDGIDPKVDVQQFDNLENYCILQQAIRSPTAPYEPLRTSVEELEKNYDEGSIELLLAKMGAYKRKLNPRLGSVSRAQFIALVASIAERRSIAPLLVTDGAVQNSFIISMASLLQSLMTQPSSSPSSETSTLEPSPSESSTRSSEGEGSSTPQPPES